MEKTVFIVKQLPRSDREYVDRNGESKVFTSVGFVFTDGLDVFYAEAVGDMARNMGVLDPQQYYNVSVFMSTRMWSDKDHKERYSTDLVISRIRPVTVTGKEINV